MFVCVCVCGGGGGGGWVVVIAPSTVDIFDKYYYTTADVPTRGGRFTFLDLVVIEVLMRHYNQ